MDDFFSSSEPSQPSPRVLQAKPVLRLLPLASDMSPRPRFCQELPLLVLRRLASSSMIHPPTGGNTRRRSAGLKPDESPFASQSASRFTSRGAHLTSGRTPERRSCSPNSIRSVESGYLLDISLFRGAPFPCCLWGSPRVWSSVFSGRPGRKHELQVASPTPPTLL